MPTIIVVDADKKQCEGLRRLLNSQDYQTIPLHSFADLEATVKTSPESVIIVDIDSVRVDNRTIRDFVLRNPGVYLLCLSTYRFHPELKDAICYHIYACINKPVDPDELFYFLRSIYENETDTKNQSAE